MTAWQLVRTHLAADVSVTALATGGIFPVRGKQMITQPQIIGRQMAGEIPDSVDGQSLMAISTLEIACIAYKEYDTAVTVFEAVRASLRTMRKTTISGTRVESVQVTNVRDEDNAEIDWFGVISTVQIRYQV